MCYGFRSCRETGSKSNWTRFSDESKQVGDEVGDHYPGFLPALHSFPETLMERPSIGIDVSTYIAFHFAILGVLSWFTGLGFLLPSLGPSIFLFATLPDDDMNYPQRIIGGQLIGAISAIIAFQLLVGHPIVGEPIPPQSLLGLRQVLSTFLAAILTTAGMFVTDWVHPPAYATTLIIALGFINDLTAAIVFFVAVLIVAGTHELFGKRLPIWDLPYQRES